MSTGTIWTIGHSTRSMEDFTAMLQSFGIKTVADIRSYPGSRHYPQFNKEVLEVSLPAVSINYRHIKELGGRRKPAVDSRNTAWRHAAFRGYADYMESPDFLKGIGILEALAREEPTAFMCSEAVWWSCHRSLVSDFLKWKGWTVWHIMDRGKATEHPYTSPARIVDGRLRYDEPGLFG